MGIEEAKMTRMVMREIGRRPLNISKVSIRVSHGAVYMYGTVSRLRGHESIDLHEELMILQRVLRAKPEIKECHFEEVILR